MCSIGEDCFGDDGLHTMLLQNRVEPSAQTTGTCSKCGQPGEVFELQFQKPKCPNCFLTYVRHKFRAAIGASKVLPRESCILIIFDGSLEAMVLMDMVQYAQTESSFKKLQCTSKLIFIDELSLSVPKLSSDKRQEYLSNLRDFCSRYENLECFVMPFSNVVRIVPLGSVNLKSYLDRDTTSEDAFIKSIHSMKVMTSQLDFLKFHRNLMIAAAAKQLECGHIFVADTSGNLAAELLSAVTLGRGGCSALDVAVSDTRFNENVKLIRPLRDLTDAEIGFYARARHINPFYLSKTNGIQCTNSLQGITREMIEKLQRNYSSTVPTVFRTGNKIAPYSTEGSKISTPNNKFEHCSFCNSSMDNVISSTLLAIEFSRYVSQNGVKAFGDFSNVTTMPSFADKSKQILCHACSNIQRDTELKISQMQNV